MNVFPSLHHAPAARRLLSVPSPRPAHNINLPDDDQAEEIFRTADSLEETRDKLLRALNTLAKSTYEQPSHNRRRARKLVLEAWVSLAGAARDLATQPPKFRAGSTSYRLIVRPRYDRDAEGVADLQPESVPALRVAR
jgi:hypothetical protein